MKIEKSKNIYNIENKQIYLINKAKSFLRKLEKEKINTAKSSFCFLNTYGNTLGNSLLNFWLKYNLFDFLFVYFRNLISISSLPNYKIKNFNNQNFKNIIITWGRRENFKNNSYEDSFLSFKSSQFKDTLIFVIYNDLNIPKKIPKNVIIFFREKKKVNLFFFFKSFFCFFIKNFLLYKKFIHYFSFNTLFSETILSHIKEITNNKKLNKIIMPYEGQTFQNLINLELKKIYPNCKTIGIIHAMAPALPINLIRRQGSPDLIYVNGSDQYKLLSKYLLWPQKKIKICKCLRLKTHNKKFNTNYLFLPISINDQKEINSSFLNYYKKFYKKFGNIIVKNHPQKNNSSMHLNLKKNLEKTIRSKNYVNKLNKNHFFYIGCTSSFIENLEKKIKASHLTLNPILDCYTNKLWKNLSISEESQNIFNYKLLKKKQLLLLSKKSYNFKNLNLI